MAMWQHEFFLTLDKTQRKTNIPNKFNANFEFHSFVT